MFPEPRLRALLATFAFVPQHIPGSDGPGCCVVRLVGHGERWMGRGELALLFSETTGTPSRESLSDNQQAGG